MTITIAQPAQATKLEAAAAARELRQFIGISQMAAMQAGARGEEKQFFFDKFVEMWQVVTTMPKTYEQDGMGDQAVAYLHYFTGAWDWFITERDSDLDGEGQHQAFGLVRGFETELGYISISKITASGAELDLHWTPKPLAEIKKPPTRVATIAGKMLITEVFTVIGRRNAPNGVKLRLQSEYGSRANDVDFEHGSNRETIEEASIDQS